MRRNKKVKGSKSVVREWIDAVSIALLLVILFRFFCYDLYVVPTTSMEGSVLAGDFLLVNKFSYGSRIPATPLSLPFAHQYMPFSESIKCYSDILRLPYLRLPGSSEIQRNDLIVFNYPLDYGFPVDQRAFYIKRCVALPGDQFEIDGKDVYVDRELLKFPNLAKFQYHVKSTKMNLNLDSLSILGITEGGRISNQGDWQLAMTSDAAEELSKYPQIDRITLLVENPNQEQHYIFPQSRNYKWNKDYFGPIIIPALGDSVQITFDNIKLYQKLLVHYESNELEITDDSLIYLNGKQAGYYVFKMNYYFMMGDNRDNSNDSRFWGFVPENHIVGKATHTLFSVDKSKSSFTERFRWKRFFSSIE
ncbi:MAG: signal peptidase I [Flavobacteriales bacterium]|nr:signal peptidase I [Flavobacteriales bacterium]